MGKGCEASLSRTLRPIAIGTLELEEQSSNSGVSGDVTYWLLLRFWSSVPHARMLMRSRRSRSQLWKQVTATWGDLSNDAAAEPDPVLGTRESPLRPYSDAMS